MAGATDKTEKSEREGHGAFFAGRHPTENPYPWATRQDECLAWTRGYNMARTEQAIANKAKADGVI